MLNISEGFMAADLTLTSEGKLWIANHGDALSIQLTTDQLEELGKACIVLAKKRKANND